ncbi:MAG: hypothetical protein AAFW87_01820 [Pseudomonadota bacterium]
MTSVRPSESVILVLSDQVLEATDLADYVASKGLGRVVYERHTEDALLVAKTSLDKISLAFVGLSRSPDVDQLINLLAERDIRVVVLDGKKGHARLPSRVVSMTRPFSDADLDKVVCRCNPKV